MSTRASAGKSSLGGDVWQTIKLNKHKVCQSSLDDCLTKSNQQIDRMLEMISVNFRRPSFFLRRTRKKALRVARAVPYMEMGSSCRAAMRMTRQRTMTRLLVVRQQASSSFQQMLRLRTQYPDYLVDMGVQMIATLTTATTEHAICGSARGCKLTPSKPKNHASRRNPNVLDILIVRECQWACR